MMNTTVQLGRVVNDIELKQTKGGTSVCRFRMAVDRDYKDKDGNKPTDFHNMVSFGGRAETLSKFVNKGDQLMVRGMIQNDNYKDKNDVMHYGYTINVQDFSFIGGQRSQANSKPQTNNNTQQGNNTQSDPFAGQSSNVDVKDSDLPF